MDALVGPLSMICGVLAVAGIAKLVSPRPTGRAMALIGLPVPALGVRLLGLAEVLVAVGTIAVGGTLLPVVVGAIHVAFAAVILVLLRRPGAASCGCFGSLDAPVTGLHLVANIVSAALAFAAAGAPGLVSVVRDQPGGGVVYLLLVATGTAGAVAVLTLLPQLRPQAVEAPAFALRASR